MSLLLKTLLALAAVVVLAAVAGTVFVLVVLNRPNEATAQYIPASATAYFSLNLRPGLRQTLDATSFFSKIESDELEDWREERLDEIEDATGIHPTDDISGWLGTDISAAILSSDPDATEWVIMLQVKDRGEAEDFAEDLTDYISTETGRDFDEDSDDDLSLWVAKDDSLAVAVSDTYLLIGDTEDTVDDIAKNIESPPRKSLLDNEEFIAARDAAPVPRVAFGFVDLDALWEIDWDTLGQFEVSQQWLRDLERGFPDYLSLSTSFVDGGIRLDIAYVLADGAIVWNSAPVSVHEVLPPDAVFATAATGIVQVWDEMWYYIEDADPAVADDLERSIEEFYDQIGIDIEQDIIDALSGEAAFALLPSDVSPGFFNGDGEGDTTLEMLVIAGVEDRQSLEDARDDMVGALRIEGVPVRRRQLGDHELVSLSPDTEISFGQSYEIGVLVTDEWVAAGTTRESLELFHESLTGEAGSLGDDPSFLRAAEAVPATVDFLFYANIAGILEMVEDALRREARRDYRENVRPFVENLSAFLISSSITAEEVRITTVLTVAD